MVANSKSKVEQQKFFHRKYEATYGNLKPQQLPPIDWSKKDHVEALLPRYKREQLQQEKGKKQASKTIEIEGFDLWTPTKDRKLLVDVDFTIEPQKRCAVYGENGTGKTMLFDAIAQGDVRDFPTNISVHHMQEMSMDPEADKVSVIETVISSHPLRRVLVVCEEVLTKLVETKKEEDEEKKEGYQANLNMVKFMMTSIDGYTAYERASGMLRVLGFDKKGEDQPMSALSGGLRMRAALASAFFINPDVLLLDEPTNHLDLPSVLWLENNLRGYRGSFLLVTHDRHLLENVVTSVMQLQDEDILPYACGFKEFERLRAKGDKQREKDIEQFLKKNRNIDPGSPLYRKKLKYQVWQEKRYHRSVAMQSKFTFKTPKPLPNPDFEEPGEISLIKVENVRFSYNVEAGLPFIFDTPISYEIKMNTKLGVMGPNGAGKSTLLKLITGKIQPVSGKVTLNKDMAVAYFGQHSTKELSMQETAVEFMIKSFPNSTKAELLTHLERASIDATCRDKRMESLSFSQRSCVIFAKLTFVPPHLLIMDEPTNFLDIDSVDSLINAANNFSKAGGALLTVTHNRDFLTRTSKKFLSITPGAFLEYDSMKEAERATYSFVDALESGRSVDAKTAITDNRGGGAEHTEEYLATKAKELAAINAQKNAAKNARMKAAQEEEEKKAAHEAKLLAKKNAQKLDWAEGDKAYASFQVGPKGKSRTVWEHCTVKMNVPSIGVTLTRPDGSTCLVQPKKLKLVNPEGNRGGGSQRNGKGKGGRGGTNNGRGGGRNGGGKGSRGKGKGSGKGARSSGGGRGGKGGRGGRGGRRP